MNEPEYVDRTKQYFRDYYLRHRERILKRVRDHGNKNREAINARRRKSRDELKVKKRGIHFLSKKDYNKKYHMEVRAEKLLRDKIAVLSKVSGEKRPRCKNCGIDDVRVLVVNHINGDGRKELHRKTVGSFRAAILSGERGVSDLNVLCCNCNIRYEYERGRLRLPRNYEEIVKAGV